MDIFFFINDLPDELNSFCKIFTDDTKIYDKSTNYSRLQEDLNRLQNWSDKWNLYFNVEKCKVLHVGKNNPEHDYNKLNKLQRIQNHAARIVLRKPRHVSATSLLRTLHWLPVKARIQYKIACLCFQCLSHNTMPPYLSDLLHSYQPPRTLRSLDTSLLSVPRFCLETFGRRSFSVFGPTVWNSLPLPLRKTQCFSTFKKKLKTHLFEKHLS